VENENIYAQPESNLTSGEIKESFGYLMWKRFYITFFCGVPVYMFFVLVGTPEESWFFGIIGSVVFSLGSGVLAIAIPVKRKVIYVSASILTGCILAGVLGAYF